jgi:hypothetical protein
MDRSSFASGNKEAEEAKKKVMENKPDVTAPKLAAKKEVVAPAPIMNDAWVEDRNVMPNGKAVGDGHAAVTHSLVPDSFINKLNDYLPKK